MNRRMIALTISAVALFGLTGCTGTLVPVESASSGAGASAPASASPDAGDDGADGGDAAGGQSVAEACAIINTGMNDAMTEFQNVDASSDPQTIVDAMTTASNAIGAATGEIDNAEVVTAATGLQESFAQIAEVSKAVLVDGDTSQATQMATLGENVQTSVTAFYELCTP